MYLFWRKIVSIFFHLKYKIRLTNAENIPQLKGGFIIACSHLTYSDPPVIASVIRGKFSFMAKQELFKNPFVAWIIRRCGAFPVERGAKDSAAIDRAVSDLQSGRIFVIFPEGTRSKNGVLGRAKSGVALIAGKANAPVLPMCIMYGKNGKRSCDVAIGELIPAEHIAIDSADRGQLRHVANTIMNAISGLQKQLCDINGIPVPSAENTENKS